jgi:hypothetical protein
VEFDARVLEHQMPGGMITNLVNQLREVGIEASARRNPARDRAGAQRHGLRAGREPDRPIHGDAAGLNVMQGERYKTVPTSCASIASATTGSRRRRLPRSSWTVRCASGDAVRHRTRRRSRPPSLERVRRTRGPFKTDERPAERSVSTETTS